MKTTTYAIYGGQRECIIRDSKNSQYVAGCSPKLHTITRAYNVSLFQAPVRANTKYDGKKLGRGKAAPPFPRSRFHVLTVFHVPFNYASSLLTESLEQATTIISMSNVLKLHGSKQTKAVVSSLTVFYLPEVSHGVWLYCIPGSLFMKCMFSFG